MSRFLKTMIVLLTIAAFAAPAFATDFSISGSMRAEGYYVDANFDAPGVDNTEAAWFDQRFRIGMNFKVSDEVKAVFRADFGENQWGSTGLNSIRSPGNDKNFQQMHIDKAYLQLDKELFSVTAGQQYFGLGNTIAVDHVGPGFILALKTPVTFKAMFTKVDENGSFLDDSVAVDAQDAVYGWDDDDNDPTTPPVWGVVTPAVAATEVNYEDTNFYAADVGFKSDTFSVNGFYAAVDNGATDDNKSVIGLAGKLNLDAFNLIAELNLFDGDNGAGLDYMGTQAYVDASFGLGETFTLGGFFLYAQGSDDEKQLTHITDWASFMPETYGYLATMGNAYGETFNPGIVNGLAGTFAAEIVAVKFGGAGLNAGIISPAVYADLKVSDNLGFKFMAQYLMEEDDSLFAIEAINMNVSTKYKVATNTYLIAQVNYIDGEMESNIAGSEGTADFDSMGLWTQLVVSF